MLWHLALAAVSCSKFVCLFCVEVNGISTQCLLPLQLNYRKNHSEFIYIQTCSNRYGNCTFVVLMRLGPLFLLSLSLSSCFVEIPYSVCHIFGAITRFNSTKTIHTFTQRSSHFHSIRMHIYEGNHSNGILHIYKTYIFHSVWQAILGIQWYFTHVFEMFLRARSSS